MSKHKNSRQGRPMRSNRVWIVPEPNEKLDARKLSRAFLALALHRATNEAKAQHDHLTDGGSGDGDGQT